MQGGDAFARLQVEMERPVFHHWLRPEAVSASDDRIEIALTTRPEFCHSAEPALIHGGIVASLVDIAGHAVVAVAQGCPAPTLTLSVEFLRPAPAGVLRATGLLRKLGRTLSRADVEIYAGDKLVALGRGTFANPGGQP
ncbi:PaaI family thioesterase [Salipiger sp. P9]|uniref:PaaI family thioesterase n=1 Tax=Salipiger pentaromativorans TaxID=2943193 RepID=UPI0021585C46|nr:PaaI family thioesterase [Salipiger pentaromativorans]MCR8549226.1 PaaI family thioesterase [Salipiger pentaromativorans]